MMTLPIYVIANGSATQHVFNALASGSQHFIMLIGMAGLLALITASLCYRHQGNILTAARWSGLFFLMTILLGSPLLSQDVQIIDKTHPIQSYNVVNVPIGLAVPASLISEIMFGITESFDALLPQANDSKMENK